MKKKSRTIVYFGNERLATGVTSDTPIIRALIEAGYKIACIVANFEQGKSRNARPLEIADIAAEHNIPLLTPKNIDDTYGELKARSAYAGVLTAYGRMIPAGIIDLFPAGIINVHPSLLPLHRGPAPIESAILGGDKKTGASIMQLSQKMDAGPVFAQSQLLLNGSESKQYIANALLDISRAMLIELLPEILEGTISAVAQDDSRASYDQPIKKTDGLINWQKPAEQIEREIRAYAGWPKSTARIGGLDIVITKAAVSEQKNKPGSAMVDNKKIFIGCQSGSIEILELVPSGKTAMSAEAFLAGYSNRLG